MNRREAVIGLGALALSACNVLENSTNVLPDSTPPVTETASVFGGWQETRSEFGEVTGSQCPALHPWDSIRTEDRVPLLGKYNEAELYVSEQRLRWMEFGNVDQACYQGEWSHELAWKRDARPFLMAHNIENHSESSPVKHFASNWDVTASSDDKDNYWKRLKSEGFDAQALRESWKDYGKHVSRYMARPNYTQMAA